MSEIWQDIRTWRFWRRLFLHTLAAIGALSVAIGLTDVLFPEAITGQGPELALAIALASTIYGTQAAWPRPIEQTYHSPNTKVRIVKGDLFDQDCHLVIGMCDTFDTSVPNIIARSSVQAQFLDSVFHGDIQELDARLDEALTAFTPVGVVEKPGKHARFAIGTVATLREHSRRYFCLAYTRMNERNEARGSIDGIWRSLDCLWRAACAHANGEPLAIPVIGGGQARVSQVLPAQDSIRFIVLSFILASRREKISDELRVVVRPTDYEQLDRQELQAFLSSLRSS